jgi:transmembrane 9 superfamily protein 2/4
MISRGYHHNWIIDNLPAATIIDTDEFMTASFVGFPVGYYDDSHGSSKGYYLYNHVNILLDYHSLDTDNLHRVVGFYVTPLSIQHSFEDGMTWDGKSEKIPPLSTCSSNIHQTYADVKMHQRVEINKPFLFTYDVIWQPSEVKWAL